MCVLEPTDLLLFVLFSHCLHSFSHVCFRHVCMHYLNQNTTLLVVLHRVFNTFCSLLSPSFPFTTHTACLLHCNFPLLPLIHTCARGGRRREEEPTPPRILPQTPPLFCLISGLPRHEPLPALHTHVFSHTLMLLPPTACTFPKYQVWGCLPALHLWSLLEIQMIVEPDGDVNYVFLHT